MNNKIDFDTRHKQFLDAGKKLVKGDDVSKVSAAAIARACKVSAPLVFAHFKDRDVLRAAVREYIKTGKIPAVNIVLPKPRKVAVKVAKPKVKVAAAKKSPAKKVVTKKVAAKKPVAKKAAAKKPVAKKAKKPAAPKVAKGKFAPAPAPTVVVAE